MIAKLMYFTEIPVVTGNLYISISNDAIFLLKVLQRLQKLIHLLRLISLLSSQ